MWIWIDFWVYFIIIQCNDKLISHNNSCQYFIYRRMNTSCKIKLQPTNDSSVLVTISQPHHWRQRTLKPLLTTSRIKSRFLWLSSEHIMYKGSHKQWVSTPTPFHSRMTIIKICFLFFLKPSVHAWMWHNE